MQVHVSNLGAIKNVQMEIRPLTILCGNNNTGKSYLYYLIYGFLRFWQNDFTPRKIEDWVQKLYSQNEIEICLDEQVNQLDDYLAEAACLYKDKVCDDLAMTELNKNFELIVKKKCIFKRSEKWIESRYMIGGIVLTATRKDDNIILFVVAQEQQDVDYSSLKDTISYMLWKTVLGCLHNVPGSTEILTADRMGISLFFKELDTRRYELVSQLSKKNMDYREKLLKFTHYSKPIDDNIALMRRHWSTWDGKSAHTAQSALHEIMNGRLRLDENDIVYIDENTKRAFNMVEVSSSIRALSALDLLFQSGRIRNGMLFIYDEPEMNLHPNNQRKLVRLLARLVNSGVYVMISTHSDYVIREINLLLLLNKNKRKVKIQDYGYTNQELLKNVQVALYIQNSNGEMEISEVDRDYGISPQCFDDTIMEMNAIQDKLIWGDVDNA